MISTEIYKKVINLPSFASQMQLFTQPKQLQIQIEYQNRLQKAYSLAILN